MKSKKKIIAIASFVCVLVVLVCFIGSKSDESAPVRDYAQIVEHDTLRVVTEYSVIGYYVDGSTIAGFNHDLLKLLEAHYPGVIEIQLEGNLDKQVQGLQAGTYDLIASDMPITTQMKEHISFTSSLFQNKQVLVQRKASDSVPVVRSMLDLAKKTIHISKYSPAKLRLDNLQQEIADTIYCIERDFYNADQLVMEVAHGEIDYTICDEKTARRIAEKIPNIDVSTPVGLPHLGGWGVRKDAPVLLDSLNRWLQEIEKTKEFKQIYTKYYLR